jgi:hypothetical protein
MTDPGWTMGTDFTALFRIRRQNGYIFLTINEKYVGQYAYATPITSVNILSYWQNTIGIERWVEYIKVSPREVVL